MKYIFVLLAWFLLSWCFHRDEPALIPDGQPTPDTTATWGVVETGSVMETWAVDATGADIVGTGFNTKDFSDPEVEEVIDLLEELIEK